MSDIQALLKWKMSDDDYQQKLTKVLPQETIHQSQNKPEIYSQLSGNNNKAIQKLNHYEKINFIVI